MATTQRANRPDAQRRRLLGAAVAAAAVRPARAQAAFRVVVVGGGFAGATCARYLKLWAPRLDVTLVEPKRVYVACPMSNRILAGTFDLRELARDYRALAVHFGVRVVAANVTAIDLQARSVRLADNTRLPWDRLVLAPGIEFDSKRIDGLAPALDSGRILHAWQGGSGQITALRKRIAEMRPGGVVAMHVPKAPYRCPPGPYERASLIASFLARNNAKAKILLFDSNPDIQSKRDLFLEAWKTRYPGIIEYVPDAQLERVLDDGQLQFSKQGRVRADVVNVIPPQRAPALLRQAGLVPPGASWCPVDYLGFESTQVPGVHVIGDSILSAPGVPKSAHFANQTGKVCAATIAAVSGKDAKPTDPVIANTCYSFVNAYEAMHVAAVFRYDGQKRIMVPVKGAGGLSRGASAAEAVQAIGWAFNIMHDTFGATLTLEPMI